MKIKFYTVVENEYYKNAFFLFNECSGRFIDKKDEYVHWDGNLHIFNPRLNAPTFTYERSSCSSASKFQPIESDEDNQRLMDMMIEHGVWPDVLRGLKV